MCEKDRESEIHDIHKIGSGMKLYYLWVRGYSTWGERETQSFYADCFYIYPKPCAAPHLQTTGLASVGPESQPSHSDTGTQLPAFLKSQNPQPTFPVHDVIHTPGPIFLSGVLFWHLWMTHLPCMRVNTCAHVCT